MTGSEVRQIREGLELTARGLARLIGVHSSTVYRWESARHLPAKIESFQLDILVLAQFALKQRGAQKFVAELRFALVAGGDLFALYRLLDFALIKHPFYSRIIKSGYRKASGEGRLAHLRP